MYPRIVLFVCVENSNRSQMAEAFARMHGGAGVEPASGQARDVASALACAAWFSPRRI